MYINKPKLLTGSALAAPFVSKSNRAYTKDSMYTFDQMTLDSTGAFLISELERLDPMMHEPLVSTTWSRDMPLREDVTIADEISSFTNSTFASPGGMTPGGISWIGRDANAIAGMSLDIGKTGNPLFLWGQELSYTIPELESAMKLGRPVDSQKLEGIQLKHSMDIDQVVYQGDALLGTTGFVNNASVSTANVANGASASPLWSTKTPDEILTDVNTLLNRVWTNSGWAVMPSELRVPPIQFGILVSTKVSSAGNISILEFLRANSLCNAANGTPLNIQPIKWLIGAGASATNRMLAYTKDKKRVRFPMTPLQRTPLQYKSIWQSTTYFGRLGVVEFPYAETVGYADGI
jgi:hypothetical protein